MAKGQSSSQSGSIFIVLILGGLFLYMLLNRGGNGAAGSKINSFIEKISPPKTVHDKLTNEDREELNDLLDKVAK